MERRLAAVLAADIVAYSRLMGEDEAGTHSAVKSTFKELLEPKAVQYHGRIVKLTGDGALMEFASAVDAVSFAVEVQCAMREHNLDVPEEHRIDYRVGINIGDIIIEPDDIYGDGVNIAARLEGLADPGGICIARNVFNQVNAKLDLTFEDLGKRQVKNIAEPLAVYRVLLDDRAEQLVTEVQANASGRGRWRIYVAAATAVLILVAGAFWWRPWTPGTEIAPTEQKATLPLTDKPVIAVLPFDNMSGDPKQDYFSDGITADLITDLSRISGLFVIARNTVFTYKGAPVKVQQVARELGAGYVLEGSVRKAGNRVRVNAQLVNARTGHHLWAGRYDRELTDVFALQDEVAQKIVAALAVRLRSNEKELLSRSARAHPEAYDMLLRGLEKFRRFTRETNAEARELFERAVALDPTFARAHADLAVTHMMEVQLGWSDDPKRSAREGLKIAQQALAFDDSVREVHFVLNTVYRNLKRHDDAIAAGRRSIAMDPNYADGFANLAQTLNSAGQPDDGLANIKMAMRLNRWPPFFYVWILGQSHYLLGRFEEAAEQFERVKRRNPHFPAAHAMLAATYSELGRTDDAEWAAAELETLLPNFTLAREMTRAPYKDDTVLRRYIDGLRKAGLPE